MVKLAAVKSLHVRRVKHDAIHGLVFIGKVPAIYPRFDVRTMKAVIVFLHFLPENAFAVCHVRDFGASRHIEGKNQRKYVLIVPEIRGKD